MVKTGFAIPDWMNWLAIFLPLIPVFIILFRRTWHKLAMNFLMILCLIAFIHHLLLGLPQLININSLYTDPIFQLLEFVILLCLFKSFLIQKWIRECFNLFLISFLSVIITIYILKGLEVYSTPVAIIEAVVMLTIILLTFIQLVRFEYIFIFQSPFFWIAAGALCYYSMFLLLTIAGYYQMMMAKENPGDETILFLGLFNLLRYVFYIIAATVTHRKKQELTIPLF